MGVAVVVVYDVCVYVNVRGKRLCLSVIFFFGALRVYFFCGDDDELLEISGGYGLVKYHLRCNTDVKRLKKKKGNVIER